MYALKNRTCMSRKEFQSIGFFLVEMCNLLFGSKLTISRRNRN
jgi:hypothetical protein